jgi:hypothetical protein
VQLTEEEIANEISANKHNATNINLYKLEIIDKTINEIILIYENKNINDLIEIMNGFDLNRYSRKLTGSNMYLWEA